MSPVGPYLPLGLTLETLLAYAIGLMTFVSVVAVWGALVVGDPRAARQRMIARRR